MRFLLITDKFYPDSSANAIHMHDLAIALSDIGHDVVIFHPEVQTSELQPLSERDYNQVKIRVRNISSGSSHVKRLVAEFFMAYRAIKLAMKDDDYWSSFDGVIWYSPTIFWTPFVKYVTRKSRCKSYLVLRDIFPDWLVDVGLMRNQVAIRMMKYVANLQYKCAHTIGVQCPGNKKLMLDKKSCKDSDVEVLWNWVPEIPKAVPCANKWFEGSFIDGRFIFVYAGNIGLAQGIDFQYEVVRSMSKHRNIGFLFVGRGSEKSRLEEKIRDHSITNALFIDEIPSDEIPGLLSHCHAGFLAVDRRHKSHNIPGKFLAYMQNRLPVLACVNKGNDIIDLIRDYDVGFTYTGEEHEDIETVALGLHNRVESDNNYEANCDKILKEVFSVENCVKQITSSF